MLNVEKLLKDNREKAINVFTTDEQLYCIKVDYNNHITPFFDAADVDMKDCEGCIFKEGKKLCSDEFLSWLFREYKEPQLTRAAYYFLKYLAEEDDGHGEIYIRVFKFGNDVLKQLNYINNDDKKFFAIDNAFDCLVPDRKYKISDLISKYEADNKKGGLICW